MMRTIGAYVLGLLSGLLIAYAVAKFTLTVPAHSAKAPDICYSCFWDGYDPKLRSDLVQFYRGSHSDDLLIAGDTQYILWRAANDPNCSARTKYQTIVDSDRDPLRAYVAAAILAFGADECGADATAAMKAAAERASVAGFTSATQLLREMATKDFHPHFAQTEIKRSLAVPAGASTMILGESKLEITPHMRVGTQVERVARDWISYQLRWPFDERPLSAAPLNYHEGAVVHLLQKRVPIEVYPLTGAVLAREANQWYAPDETGTFRFQVLEDKVQYPTTHVWRETAWVEDTHGISALVPQALERKVDVVIGCGDAAGKAEAAFYLSQKGINVLFPGDRYQDMLLGYEGKGVLLGGAPIHMVEGRTYVGGQPIAFSLNETIIVQDTKHAAPLQYYDAPARYFRALTKYAPLRLDYVLVDAQDELYRVLTRARERKADVVAVRVMTQVEDASLRAWLSGSPQRRAILFHSGLYPYAQALFAEFPQQVTFGDLRPQFR
jgi:hypothetical protein